MVQQWKLETMVLVAAMNMTSRSHFYRHMFVFLHQRSTSGCASMCRSFELAGCACPAFGVIRTLGSSQITQMQIFKVSTAGCVKPGLPADSALMGCSSHSVCGFVLYSAYSKELNMFQSFNCAVCFILPDLGTQFRGRNTHLPA